MEDQQPTGGAQNSQKKEWYKNKWTYVVGVFLFLTVIIGGPESKKDAEEKTKQAEQVSAGETRSTTKQPEERQEPTKEEPEQETPIEPFEIVVTSQIVKKIDGKHRYFFDIRNNDKKDFNGKVSITLHNDKQTSALGGDTFVSSSAIKPKLGTSVYIDINTGPVSVHGEYGITKFKFEAKIDDKSVKSGEGTITSKYEDSSTYGL